MTLGSTPTTAHPTSRPSGRSPRSAAKRSLATTSAAAPSQIPEAFPAVTTPSGRNTGRSWLRPSRVVSGRMCSSAAHSTVPPRLPSGTATGTTSAASAPDSQALRAHCWLRSA